MQEIRGNPSNGHATAAGPQTAGPARPPSRTVVEQQPELKSSVPVWHTNRSGSPDFALETAGKQAIALHTRTRPSL
jgi:hypothetical protein